MAHTASPPALVLRTDRLGGVLDDDEPRCLGHPHHGVHVGHLAIEVHGNDCAGPVRHVRGNPGCVEIERHRIDIDKHRSRPDAGNRTGRRKKGVGSRDHLVARTNVFGHQASEQGVGARRNSDGV